MTPLLEGWSTKAKEAADPTGHQPSISMSQGRDLKPSSFIAAFYWYFMKHEIK